MDTTAVSASNGISASAATGTVEAKNAFALESDFTTFLNLLTAQLRNQDPMNPTDSTQFVAQLAQFSNVEQAVKSNKTLDAILGALGGEGPGALAPWLGSAVSAPAALPFDGETPVKMTVDSAPEFTAAALLVRNEAGLIVATVPVDPQATELTWDGTGAIGAPGFYRFSLVRENGDETLPPAIPRGFAKVMEARLGAEGAVELVLEGGDVINAADVNAIRQANS